MKIKIMALFLIAATVYGNDILLDNSNQFDFGLKISKNENEHKLTGKLDFGGGDNLLGGLQAKVYKQIDNRIDPLVLKLEKLKEKNMKMLNTETYTGNGYGEKLGNKFLEMINADSFSKSTKKFKEKYKGGIGSYIFNNKKFEAKTSKLNPFSNFRKKLERETAKIKTKIDNFNYVEDYLSKKMDKSISTFDEYRTLSLDSIDMTGNNSGPENQYYKSILSGQSPTKSFDTFYKAKYPDYYPSATAVSFNFLSSPMPTNNMCEITKCIFGKCSGDLKNKAEDLKAKAEELRKALLQKAVYVLVKKLIKEFYIQEYIQFAQRAMSCSVEASISTTAASFGLSLPKISTSGIKGKVDSKPKPATSNAQNVQDTAKKTADCLRVDDQNNKNENDLDMKLAANAQGNGFDFYGVTASAWEPFLGLGGGVKMKTDKPLKKYADKKQVNNCILEGKLTNWKNAYNSCMSNKETSQIKFNADLQLVIQDLFSELRKHKKIQCELTKEMSKTNKMNFSLLKYTNLIPSLLETDYNEEHSTKSFMEAIAFIINNNIDIENFKTENQICIDSMFSELSDCNIKTKDKEFHLSSASTLEYNNNIVKDFCEIQGKDFLNIKNIKTLLEDKNEKEKITPLISDINYCSNYFKKTFEKNIVIFKKTPMDNLLIETLLELKYKYEDDNTFDKRIFNTYKNTYNSLDKLSYDEKITVCNNKVVNIVNSDNEDDIYSLAIQDAVKKYCLVFKNEIADKELNKAFNDYKTMDLDMSSVNTQLKDVKAELLKYRGL